MTKKGPLSNVDKDYIRNNMSSPVTELAEHLDRAEGTVKKFLDSITETISNKAGNRSKSFDMFARNGNGATVMTPNASELTDELKKETKLSTKTQNCITSIRNNE